MVRLCCISKLRLFLARTLKAFHNAAYTLAYKSSNHGRRRLPSSPTASISYPTTPTIPPAWFIEDDTQGNNNMQKLTTRLGYEPQLGRARSVIRTRYNVACWRSKLSRLILLYRLLNLTINISYQYKHSDASSYANDQILTENRWCKVWHWKLPSPCVICDIVHHADVILSPRLTQ